MHHNERFEQIKELLKKTHKYWSREVINSYPSSYDLYDPEWIEELSHLSDRELWLFDNKKLGDKLSQPELKKLIDALYQLEDLPAREINSPKGLPSWATYNVKGKKLHEINKLIPLINELKQQKNLDSAVDIGGGVGHLARILAFYNELSTTTIDFNREFQELGKARAMKYPLPVNAKTLTYIHHEFGEASQVNPQLKEVFNQNCISLGLHTCGDLANKHISMFIKNKNPVLLNFGCCYSKISDSHQLNLSQLAQRDPIEINAYGLTLATRGHNQITYDEYLFKKQVKKQRYLLHLYMIQKLGFQEFVSLGNGKAKDYWQDFAHYAKVSLKNINYELDVPREILNNFAKENEALVQKLFIANLIRWQLGRILEIYILLDRALYLQEQGIDAELVQVFDSTLSPRNIALIALK